MVSRAAITAAASLLLVAGCRAILGLEGDGVLAPIEAGADVAPLADVAPPEDAPEAAAPEEAGASGPHERLALGFLHGCSRRRDATVRCWGDNALGQVGAAADGATAEPVLLPTPVAGLGAVSAISAGTAHTCAVRADGTVSCWGSAASGQLGNGAKESRSPPVIVSGLADATAVAAGGMFTCALKSNGTVVCWGANANGQIGDGTKQERLTPAVVKTETGLLSGAGSITAGDAHACAVLTNGEVACWGNNSDGQLGTGAAGDAPTATRIAGISDVVEVSAAAQFTCARRRAGEVLCWGTNAMGQLGTGASTPVTSRTPVPSLVRDAIAIAAGRDHACALDRGGVATCWGRANEGQLGSGPDPPQATFSPAPVVGLPSAASVATAGDRSCVVTAGGRALCWGANALGQLGDGTQTRALSPVPLRD
jgi:alpha-tubulin suppressor-like RCC1 family protein